MFRMPGKPSCKTVHLLDFPYASPPWPEVSRTDQEALLELLCSLLSPVGQHRATSSSSRSKNKKKPKSAKLSYPTSPSPSSDRQGSSGQPRPPPEITSFLTIGLNATTRALEDSVASRAPSLSPSVISEDGSTNQLLTNGPANTSAPSVALSRLFAVFITLPDSRSERQHSHLPVLCAVGPTPRPKLITLPAGAEAKLATALALTSVSVFGLAMGAPIPPSLLDLIARVPYAHVPWLVGRGVYQPTKVKALLSREGKARRG